MKENKHLGFERKERPVEKVRTRFYTIAKVYWTAIPLLYFFLLSSAQSRTGEGIEAAVSGSPEVLLQTIAQFSTIILSGLLFLIGEDERKKSGLAGLVFKAAIAQQLVVGNFLGIALAVLAHRELPIVAPEKNAQEEKKTIGKTGVFVLLGLLIVLSLIVGYGRWVIGN